MLLSPHIAIGAAIGHTIPDPYLAGAVSFGSHYLLDMIPHWQETLAPYKPTKWTFIRGGFEVLVIILFIYYLKTQTTFLTTSVIVGMVASLAPDLDAVAIPFKKLLKFNPNKVYKDWHEEIQNETPHFYGVVTQLFFIALGLIVIFYS